MPTCSHVFSPSIACASNDVCVWLCVCAAAQFQSMRAHACTCVHMRAHARADIPERLGRHGHIRAAPPTHHSPADTRTRIGHWATSCWPARPHAHSHINLSFLVGPLARMCPIEHTIHAHPHTHTLGGAGVVRSAGRTRQSAMSVI
jgi:hypothetical protein